MTLRGTRSGIRVRAEGAGDAQRGTVIGGDEWGAPMERMTVPPARHGSWEDVLHRAVGTSGRGAVDPLHMPVQVAGEPGETDPTGM
jgi:erythromycin esterase-like protein